MKKPVVDRDVCNGSAVCVEIAPGVFDLNDQGKAFVEDPQGASEEIVQQAIGACPVDAISWKEK
ncbi:ferredoxin [candidate division MSBL1 archaeon SCGC-AAA382A20]|uniref:Ferredoxin n=1 Tax=candidate division MSBL1 archaeon SCGC-AAA382A20 TaxID=1698280 RepID=A0A133VIQ8_9EURY|nr:ferredoxin [candidate division MSBL1 archaeon SCGC-AAA382A20]